VRYRACHLHCLFKPGFRIEALTTTLAILWVRDILTLCALFYFGLPYVRYRACSLSLVCDPGLFQRILIGNLVAHWLWAIQTWPKLFYFGLTLWQFFEVGQFKPCSNITTLRSAEPGQEIGSEISAM